MRLVHGILLLFALGAGLAIHHFLTEDGGLGDADPAARGQLAGDADPLDPATLAGARPRDPRRGPRTPRGVAAEKPPPPLVAGRAALAHEGRILDSRGRPLADAEVTVRDGARVLATARTNGEGEFQVELPPGRYLVMVEGRDGSVFATEALLQGAARESLTLRVPARASLDLRVVMQGEPLADTRIDVALAHDWRVPTSERVANALTSVTTGAAGAARVDDLALGAYDLIVTAPWGSVIRLRHDHGSETTKTIDVRATATLRGQVTDGKDGPGVSDALVTVTSTNRGSASSYTTTARTRPEGTFEMAVPRSTYQSVVVDAEGYRVWPPVAGRKEDQRARAKILEPLNQLVRGREASVTIPLERFRGPAVRGRVIDAAGEPVMGVAFEVNRGTGRQHDVTVEVRTDEHGRFEIERLRSTRYTLRVRSPDWVISRASQGSFVIPRDQEEPVEVEMSLVEAVQLTGRVVTAAGSSVGGARVWLMPSSPWRPENRLPDAPAPHETFTNAAGRFRIGGLASGRSYAIRAASGTLQAMPVKASTRTQAKTAFELVLLPALTLRGRVVEMGSRLPLAGARVEFEPVQGAPAGRPRFRIPCHAEGRYEVASILPSKWRIRPWSWWHLDAEWTEHDFTDRPGEQTLDLELDPGLALAGYVLDTEKRPLVAKVKVSGKIPGRKGTWSRQVRSDARGRFRVTGLRKGAYAIHATAPGHRAHSESDLQGGEEHLEILLKPMK